MAKQHNFHGVGCLGEKHTWKPLSEFLSAVWGFQEYEGIQFPPDRDLVRLCQNQHGMFAWAHTARVTGDLISKMRALALYEIELGHKEHGNEPVRRKDAYKVWVTEGNHASAL